MSQLASIGIDFGSQRSVIAVALRGGVKILDNEGSHRETQNIVGFGAEERFIGEQGALQQKSNFKNTVNYFNRFLGITAKASFFQEEAKWLTVPTVLDDQGRALFEVNYLGEKAKFTPEQLTASMLNILKKIIKRNDINIQASNVCLSVPPYYTEAERKAILDACKIADIPIERLLNETTATAINYGLFRKNELDEKEAKYVAFVDFGHSKFSAFVGQFYKESAKILAQVNDRNLGARNIDWIIFQKYAELFESSTGMNIRNNAKARLRMLETIEKQRKVLSANSEAPCNVEYLMEDEDFNHLLKREEFDAIIQPILSDLQLHLENLANQIANLKINVSSVEIIGGATRIPAVQRLIEKIFKIEQVSRTLNASESVARGCAMMAARRSRNFRVTTFDIEDVNFHPIRVGWLYSNKLQDIMQQKMNVEQQSLTQFFPEKQSKLLFDANNQYCSNKAFSLTKTEPIEITFYYDPVPQGFQSIIAQVRVPAQFPKHPDHFVKIRTRMNENGIFQLEDVALNEDYIEEVKVPIKQEQKPAPKPEEGKLTEGQAPAAEGEAEAPKPAQPVEEAPQQFEIKKEKRSTQTVIKDYQLTGVSQLKKEEIDNFFQKECEMMNQDLLTQETYFRKNQLEAYIYKWKENLNGVYAQHTTNENKQAILKQLEAEQEWLYDAGVKSTKKIYTERYDKLVAQCGPIATIYEEFTQLPEIVAQALQQLPQFESFVTNQSPQYAHITPEERGQVDADVKGFKEWCQQLLERLSKAVKHQRFDTSIAQVNEKLNELKQKCLSVMNKPAPAPKETKVETEAGKEKPAGDAGVNEEKDKKMETE